MKIGIDSRCLEWHRGGVARILTNILPIWIKKYPDYTFILYFQNEIPPDPFLSSPNVVSKLIRGPAFLRKRRILCEQLLLPRALYSDNLDIFLATWYTAPFFFPRSLKIFVCAWDISYSTHPSHYKFSDRISLGLFSKLSCSKSVGVITCSEFDAHQINKYYSVSLQNIKIVHLAGENRFSQDLQPDVLENIRNKYKLPENYVLYLGTIYNRRNIDKLILAFEKLHRSGNSSSSLIIFGKNLTIPRVDIDGLIFKINANAFIKYIPWADDDDLPALYKMAKLYTCISTVDGEAIMLKEALLSKTLTLVSKNLFSTTSGNSLVIENADSDTSIKSALENALHYEDSSTMVDSGYEYARSLSWDIVSNDIISFMLQK